MKELVMRNIRPYTKGCPCLYVYPTGVTNTGNSIINPDKYIGCGVCTDSCSSGAISMVSLEYPPQQPKLEAVIKAMGVPTEGKAEQENAVRPLAARGRDSVFVQLTEVMEESNRPMTEGILQEAGYIFSQSRNARRLFQSLLDNLSEKDFPGESVKRLLDMIHCNEVQ